MAEFEAKVYKLKIEPHPNADLIELAIVGDYRSIVRKGEFKTGDLGVYIPEAAVCPDWIIATLGLEGKLAGKDKNRVKAVKLRGVLSQGLIYPVYLDAVSDDHYVEGEQEYTRLFINEGDDVTQFLGLTKWEPPIPTHMAGEVEAAFGKTLKYDIENFKKYPDVLEEGETVVMTEKVHGTWCCFGYHPDVDHPIVTSKGLSEDGLIFKLNERNENNLYVRALRGTEIDGHDVIARIQQETLFGAWRSFYILGEVYGQGVQDLHYAANAGVGAPPFRVFDIYLGEPNHGRFLNHDEMLLVCMHLGLDTVPMLYNGPFSKQVMLEHTDGRETVSGEEINIREGLVVKPAFERKDPELGRVILKSVSEKYLLRKKATEYN